MTGKIFISYRRDDEAGNAGRLASLLRQKLPATHFFFDVDSIKPGTDYLEVIKEQIANSDAVVSVIGPRWIDLKDDKGQRRLDDSEDPVRFELETALNKRQRKLIYPVLVGKASMPKREQLPEGLALFARLSAITLTNERFESDCETLINALKEIIPNDVSNDVTKDVSKDVGKPVWIPTPIVRIGLIFTVLAVSAALILSLELTKPIRLYVTSFFKGESQDPAQRQEFCKLVVQRDSSTCVVFGSRFAFAPAYLFSTGAQGEIFIGSEMKRRSAEIIKSDAEIALVDILIARGDNFKSAALSTRPLAINQPVKVLVFQDGQPPSVVSTNIVEVIGARRAVIGAKLSADQAGSPVFNERGDEVVAVVLGGSTNAPMTYVVPVSTLNSLLALAKARTN